MPIQRTRHPKLVIGRSRPHINSTMPVVLRSTRRAAAGKFAIELRQRPANDVAIPELADQPHIENPEGQMPADPTRTWIEATERWRFLLDRHAVTPAARDARIQELIRRALRDMARLKERQEQEP